jgi:hypothetical protein
MAGDKKAAAKPAAGKGKAAAAAKAARVGTTEKSTRVHTKPHFYKPKTLIADRKPKYARAIPSARGAKFDKYRVIRSPLTSER